MSGEDALLTTAEVAVAFAGFASIVTVFRRRDDGSWTPQDAVRFGLMIRSSLSALLFAMLPFAVHFFGVGERAVWAISSSLLALYLVASLVSIVRPVVKLLTDEALSPLVAWPLLGMGAAVIVLELCNAAALGFSRELGPYFVGLLYLLAMAAISFARLLPLGRPESR